MAVSEYLSNKLWSVLALAPHASKDLTLCIKTNEISCLRLMSELVHCIDLLIQRAPLLYQISVESLFTLTYAQCVGQVITVFPHIHCVCCCWRFFFDTPPPLLCKRMCDASAQLFPGCNLRTLNALQHRKNCELWAGGVIFLPFAQRLRFYVGRGLWSAAFTEALMLSGIKFELTIFLTLCRVPWSL